MLKGAASVNWQETCSEIEALILESQLIKKCRPPFNIMLRDDKQYFYVGFTHSAGSGQAKEAFPKIAVVHRPSDKNFIGPFTDGTALHVTLKLLRRIFPYCTCKQKHNNYCLNYHIGNCFGFCCLKKEMSAEEIKLYRKNISAVKAVLGGRKGSLIKKLEKEMNAEARKSNFEEAIRIRTQIEKMRNFFENTRVIKELELKNKESERGITELKRVLKLDVLPVRIEGYDISNIQGEFATGAMAVFTRSASSGQADFQPDKNEYRKFKIKFTATPNDAGMLKEILTRRFGHREWKFPDLIIIDGGKGQLSAAKAAVPKGIPVIAQTKDAKHKGHHIYVSIKKSTVPLKNLPTAARNLILQIDAEAHRFAIGYYRKLHGKIFK